MQKDPCWDQVESAVNSLFDAWQDGNDVDLGRFVPDVDAPHRRSVVVTLIKIDQEHRWNLGEHRLLESYLDDWPELRDDPEAVIELLRAECRIHVSHDTSPVRAELQARFPALSWQNALKAFEEESRADLATSGKSTLSLALLESMVDHGDGTISRKAAPALPPGTRFGRYCVNSVIGRGGMGTVYLARDDELDRTVAVKVLHKWILPGSEEVDLLLTEARTAAKLQHPAVVPIYDVGKQEDGTGFFVMEYVDGNSLAHRIAAGPMDPTHAVNLIIQVADALHCAHEHGLVHRDIKLANILIDSEGRARITDFGLAIERCDQADRVGEYSGTLPYMAHGARAGPRRCASAGWTR